MNSRKISWRQLRMRFAASLLLAFAGTAGAQTFGAQTDPTTPRAGQTFKLSLFAPTCHVFWAESPLDRTIEVAGDIITVTVEYTPPGFGGGCDASTVREVFWTVGPFPPGDYTLLIEGNDPIDGTMGEGIDQVAVTILPALPSRPSVVPVGGAVGWLSLAGLLLVGAWVTMRSRQ